MPWHIERRGGRFCVIKDADGENEGCHDTREAAQRQMAALYANEGRGMDANPRNFVPIGAEEITEDGRQWIEVMPTGEKLRNGPWFFTIEADDLEAFAESIRENGDTTPIDFDHSASEGRGTKAAGWFTGQAEVRETDDGPRLWAEVHWTPDALEDIKARRYRFISPEWEMENRDAKTGLLTKAKRFIAATLTNRPFFRELAAVGSEAPEAFLLEEEQVEEARTRFGDETYNALFAAANASDEAVREPARAILLSPPKENHMDDLKQIAAELGLGEDASDEDILAAIKSAKEKQNTDKKGPAVSTNLKAVAEALGLNPDADAATVIADLHRTIDAAKRVATVEEENQRLGAEAAETRRLSERVKVLEAERKAERVDVMLADAVRLGKVIPAEKSVLAKQFAANPDALAELLESRAAGLFSLTPRGSGERIEDEPEDVQKVVASHQSTEADGVDVESARLHARAVQSLRSKGKTTYTEDEYLQELELVSAA